MTGIILAIFESAGLVVFLLGLQGLAYVPLTLMYEAWKRNALKHLQPFEGFVSVILPAYNEEKTVVQSIESVLLSEYPNIEVIVVNDGSTDSTAERVRPFAESGRVRYISQPNAGKAAALNAGMKAANGSVVIFTDADSIFLPDTIGKMARWFADPRVDAVCGNDAPLSPSTPIQKFLVVTTHIGTGFVRRALSYIGCLPIITGNLGAARTAVLREMGGFANTWGEDLEVTFRLHRLGKRVIFDPEPKVMAECPGDFAPLWRQRTRWLRSYIKISRMHKELFFDPRYAPFSLYLPLNFLSMTIVPLLQIIMLPIIPWVYMNENLNFTGTLEVMSFLGFGFFFFVAIYSIILDREYKDLRYLPYGMLILPMSYFYNFVALNSWYKELRGSVERWDKIERRPVVAKRRTWQYAAVVGAFAVAIGAYAYLGSGPAKPTAAFDLAVSTHFDAWGDWRKAITNINLRPGVERVKLVGVSAGRSEWVYFKWAGREDSWSNHQKTAQEDMLGRAADSFAKRGFKVAAFIDVFGPSYIKAHPGTGSIGFDGKINTEQVMFTELVSGAYGDRIVEMIDYVAKHYAVDIVNLTEMPYYSYSFNPEDLASYSKYSGKKAWPRLKSGHVNRDDPGIWAWRTSMMEGFIKRAADAAHRHGKALYVDVPATWSDLGRNAENAGLEYSMVLRHADKLVVWDYYHLDALPPQASATLARYLAQTLPKDSYYVSIGLWGKEAPLGAVEFEEGLARTLDAGATMIWLTPDSLVTGEHWSRMLPYLSGEKTRSFEDAKK